MKKLIETETGSFYELTDDGMKVRRLQGNANPTPRQGKDGEWKELVEPVKPALGDSMLLVWKVTNDEGVITAQTTITSRVVDVTVIKRFCLRLVFDDGQTMEKPFDRKSSIDRLIAAMQEMSSCGFKAQVTETV